MAKNTFEDIMEGLGADFDELLGEKIIDENKKYRPLFNEKINRVIVKKEIFTTSVFNWVQGMSLPDYVVPENTVYIKAKVLGIFFQQPDNVPKIVFELSLIKEDGVMFLGWR